MAKKQKAFIFGVVNVVGSSISRQSDAGAYTHAGPEIGVASTKAFTAQLVVLMMIAIKVGYANKSIDQIRYLHLINELYEIPEKINTVLQSAPSFQALAEKYKDSRDFLYLGRGFSFPIALEGDLKLKEISYIHAEGYHAAELKHGVIALVSESVPSVFIMPRDSVYDKNVSTLEEVKARKGPVIAITTEGRTELERIADDVIYIPEVSECLSPILAVIPLQLLSYHFAVARGCDVDKPRNLAKSVTVE
jgi:glucosamine--fructose-6-phosphate aminotransferase (isomerizing)